MSETDAPWIGAALEVTHSRAEAERCAHHWRELGRGYPGAEVRVWGFRAPDGSEVYLLSTRHPGLARQRTRNPATDHELLWEPKLGWLRRLPFERRAWANLDALVHRRTGKQRRPVDLEYDPGEWELIPGAWDHDHCELCHDPICSHAGHGHPSAYFHPLGVGVWVCPPCYEQRLAGWSALPLPETLSHGQDGPG
jgi:hypothetical protein